MTVEYDENLGIDQRSATVVLSGTGVDDQTLTITQEGTPVNGFSLPFSDDFTTDIGWTNETNGDFVISGEQLNYNVDRDFVQKMYIPISAYTGDFKMNFDFQLTSKENNSWIDIGLAESLTGALEDPTNDPIGTFVSCGWIGGGPSYSSFFVTTRTVYSPF